MRGLKQQHDIVRDSEMTCRVRCTVVKLNHIQALRKGLGNQVQEPLKADRIEMGEFIEETLAGFGFDDAIQVERVSLPLHWHPRLDTFGSNHPTRLGFQSQAAFILAPIANG